MALTNYIKKPPVVQAVCWGDPGFRDDLEQAGVAVLERQHPEDQAKTQVFTSTGWALVESGYFAIASEGELTIYTPDAFHAQHEAA